MKFEFDDQSNPRTQNCEDKYEDYTSIFLDKYEDYIPLISSKTPWYSLLPLNFYYLQLQFSCFLSYKMEAICHDAMIQILNFMQKSHNLFFLINWSSTKSTINATHKFAIWQSQSVFVFFTFYLFTYSLLLFFFQNTYSYKIVSTYIVLKHLIFIIYSILLLLVIYFDINFLFFH